ncbi:hypothetical protein B6E78_06670 [Edwardsiella ictaluri]|nr:hypothetical protein B6E78_06670 [Edwardsiella ictaluri]
MFRNCTRHEGSTPAGQAVCRWRRPIRARAQRERRRDCLTFSRIIRRGLFSLFSLLPGAGRGARWTGQDDHSVNVAADHGTNCNFTQRHSG